MARTGQRANSGSISGTDEISIGLLTHVFPPEVVNKVIEQAGAKEQRKCPLPANVVTYFVLGLALWSSDSFIEVTAKLFDHLQAVGLWNSSRRRPTDGAVTHARYRLGPAVLKGLYKSVARRVASPDTKGAFYRGWRLMAIDGTVFDVPDTPENDKTFGRPGSPCGRSAFPQARVVGLIEIGTRCIVDATIGGCNKSEIASTRKLVGSFQKGDLVLADRNFYSFDLWKKAADTGADLLWRVKSSNVFRPIEILSDGSYLTEVFSAADTKRTNPVIVRVIEYSLEARKPGETYRLMTTILDPELAPAKELGALYGERWEIEQGIGEIKTDLLANNPVLRSKRPRGIAQELWAILCVHFALRSQMAQIADDNGVDPDRLSFTNMVKIVSRHMANHALSMFEGVTGFLNHVANEIMQRILPERRGRSYPRVVKKSVRSAFPVKRSHHGQSTVERQPLVSIMPPSKPAPISRKVTTLTLS